MDATFFSFVNSGWARRVSRSQSCDMELFVTTYRVFFSLETHMDVSLEPTMILVRDSHIFIRDPNLFIGNLGVSKVKREVYNKTLGVSNEYGVSNKKLGSP